MLRCGSNEFGIERLAAADGPGQFGVVFRRAQAESGSRYRRHHDRSRSGRDLPQRDRTFLLDLGMRRQILEGQHVAGGKRTTDPDPRPPLNSENACSTGTRSSAARLSGTTRLAGAQRPLQQASSKALAVGVSPETRIRPVPSFRWEATREKAGNFSTSANRSRTNGRTIASSF